ncbi:MAG: transporter ATP-binding protein [Ilumatobacteraceae bacterium]|nr:transporter ATP-binding protein [Ilumatobacteraceae bacterium]
MNDTCGRSRRLRNFLAQRLVENHNRPSSHMYQMALDCGYPSALTLVTMPVSGAAIRSRCVSGITTPNVPRPTNTTNTTTTAATTTATATLDRTGHTAWHFRGAGCTLVDMTPTLSPPTAGIVLRGLVKSFTGPNGPVHAVRGVDITIAAGETVALLGPNGAGKSTTIDMLLGLTKPDAGDVHLFGMTPKEAIAHGAIGAMLQTGAVLSDLSVRELLDMMGSLYPHPLSVDETLELAGIRDLADRKTTKLSGGQTQRVRFAVAMVSNPDLLALDEPTVAMDVEGRHQFWASMRAFTSRGKTVLFATHYLEEADAYADRIILMARGEVVADGPSTEIKAAAGGRTIRGTLPGADLAALAALDGVRSVDQRGDSITLDCTDSDSAVRALLHEFPGVRDLEITGAGLEAAFLQLTGDNDADGTDARTTTGRNTTARNDGVPA